MEPLFDIKFSESSYGFRPKKNAHQAVRQEREYVRQGYKWTVDLDIERFFDNINHGKLIARIARKVEDKRVLRLINHYLKAGVMSDGILQETRTGVCQGGPLSPLLANIMLDDLDKELERRGLKFARYADDLVIFARTRRAGLRIKESLTKYLSKLGLTINQNKSVVDHPWNLKFLGFTITQDNQITVAARSGEKLKNQLMSREIGEINELLRGWLNYFSISENRQVFVEIKIWLRLHLWERLWKRGNVYRTLRLAGINRKQAQGICRTRMGVMRAANILNTLLPNYWEQQGLIGQ